MIDDYFQPMKIKYFLYILFVFQTGIQISTVFSQKQKVFSGELTYNITKISQEKLEKDFEDLVHNNNHNWVKVLDQLRESNAFKLEQV